MEYLIVLFKNKKRKKIINKFKTLDRAKSFYKAKMDESSLVNFPKKVENANLCEFELAIVSEKDGVFENYFVKDFLGRQVKVDVDGDFKIIEINPYNVPETIYDVTNNQKVTFDDFVNIKLKKGSVKLVSKLNNKVVVQDDIKVDLFSLKNESESQRFLECLSNYMISNGRLDSIIVSDTSKAQKKYLYEILNNMGVDKKLLYRTTTTFKERK